RTCKGLGFRRGVLYVGGKCPGHGPRVIEVNARMGGARIYQMVEAVWGVDLIEAQLRSCLGRRQTLKPSRKPRCGVLNALVYAPATGRLAGLPFADVAPEGGMGVELDIFGQIGQQVTGPEGTFATVLAELTLSGKNLRRARSLAAQVLREPPRILPAYLRPAPRQTPGLERWRECCSFGHWRRFSRPVIRPCLAGPPHRCVRGYGLVGTLWAAQLPMAAGTNPLANRSTQQVR